MKKLTRIELVLTEGEENRLRDYLYRALVTGCEEAGGDPEKITTSSKQFNELVEDHRTLAYNMIYTAFQAGFDSGKQFHNDPDVTISREQL